MKSKRTVVCQKRYEWVMLAIDEIVSGKRKMGHRTSYSFELYRLAANGLANTTKGMKIDRRILGDRSEGSSD